MNDPSILVLQYQKVEKSYRKNMNAPMAAYFDSENMPDLHRDWVHIVEEQFEYLYNFGDMCMQRARCLLHKSMPHPPV